MKFVFSNVVWFVFISLLEFMFKKWVFFCNDGLVLFIFRFIVVISVFFNVFLVISIVWFCWVVWILNNIESVFLIFVFFDLICKVMCIIMWYNVLLRILLILIIIFELFKE